MASETKITLLNTEKDVGDVYTFVFDVPPGFSWKSGQHALFHFKSDGSEGSLRRVFTIAASPHEGSIRITTRVGESPSEFKARLLKLRPGEELNMRGPHGSFVLGDGGETIVGVAGGVGITPFRAMLFDVYKGLSPSVIELIYSCRDREYPLAEYITEFEKSDNITVHYTSNRDEIRDSLTALERKYANNAVYYVSGPPPMVKELKERLHGDGMENVKDDPFLGY